MLKNLSLTWGLAFLFSVFSFAIPTPKVTDTVRCPICGREVLPSARITFVGERDGEKIKMCSFACASRYSKRHSTATMLVKDFFTGEYLPADSAIYLIKSEKVAKQLNDGMPPYVIAVKNRFGDSDEQKAFDDGKYVQGYLSAKHLLE